MDLHYALPAFSLESYFVIRIFGEIVYKTDVIAKKMYINKS